MRVLPCILTLFFFSHSQKGEANKPFLTPGSIHTDQPQINLQHKSDSIGQVKKTAFYRQTCLSFNILSALSREFGFLFESGQMWKNITLIIPFGFGFGDPPTENKAHSEWNQGDYLADPIKKQFDLGLGFNYYFKDKLHNQPFVGLCFRTMKYACKETWTYPSGIYYEPNISVYDQTSLYRYTATANAGFTFPLRSHFRITLMAMVGTRYDAIPERIKDPKTNEEVPNFDNPWYPYFSVYYCLGFVF